MEFIRCPDIKMMQPLPVDGYNPVELFHVLYSCLLLNILIYEDIDLFSKESVIVSPEIVALQRTADTSEDLVITPLIVSRP